MIQYHLQNLFIVIEFKNKYIPIETLMDWTDKREKLGWTPYDE